MVLAVGETPSGHFSVNLDAEEGVMPTEHFPKPTRLDIGDSRLFHSLKHDIDRLFSDFDDFGVPSLWRRDDGLVHPKLDLVDGDDEVEIKVDLPGVERDDVEISTTGNRLQIRGEKKTEENREDKNYQLVERSFGSFVRSIPLPFAVEPKSVRAALENGVLVVKVKKPEEVVAKTHKIEIGKSL